jgi:hypothetical protein
VHICQRHPRARRYLFSCHRHLAANP